MPINNQDELLEQLVENAIDFLKRSHLEFEANDLKHSVIHFYSAVELLLKARLMSEHWTLVISGRNELDAGKFLSGDFNSVTLMEANNRLSKVVGAGLSEKQLAAFNGESKKGQTFNLNATCY